MLEEQGKRNCYILRATGGSYIDETQILKRNPSAPLSLSSEEWPRDLGEARSLKRFWPWNGAGETWSDGVACSHWKELCTQVLTIAMRRNCSYWRAKHHMGSITGNRKHKGSPRSPKECSFFLMPFSFSRSFLNGRFSQCAQRPSQNDVCMSPVQIPQTWV